MKILLLEDEFMLNQSICEYLTILGHHVTKSYNGDEALHCCQKEKFDLLILDINVPGISGFMLVEELHKQQIFIPIIFISALINIEDITTGYALGAKEYLKKPFHLQELGIKINQIEKFLQHNNQHLVLSKNYSYSKETKTLYYNNLAQKLTKKQLNIIDLLAKNIGIVVDFETLRIYVWDNENIAIPTIRAEMSRLQKMFTDKFIQNEHGIGYKINRYSAI